MSDERAAAEHPGRRRRQRLAARRRLRRRGRAAARASASCRAGVAVMDAGTGGLDLAYEVMRGYDALVILDVSRQGGEPGTLYVMEPDEESVAGRDRGRRGDQPARRWTRRPCCGSSSRSAAWPGQGGRDRVRAGATSRRWGGGSPSEVGGRGRARGRARARDDRRAARRRAAPAGGVSSCTSCRCASAIVNTVVKHADGRRVTRRQPARRAPAPGGPRHARVLLRVRRPRHGVRGGAARAGGGRRRGCAAARASTSGRSRSRRSAARRCGGSDVAVASGDEFEVESIEVEEAECIAQR